MSIIKELDDWLKDPESREKEVILPTNNIFFTKNKSRKCIEISVIKTGNSIIKFDEEYEIYKRDFVTSFTSIDSAVRVLDFIYKALQETAEHSIKASEEIKEKLYRQKTKTGEREEMIDFDKMSEHEIACYTLGEALSGSRFSFEYKNKMFVIFNIKEEREIAVTCQYKDQRGANVHTRFTASYFQEAYDYLHSILY